MRSAQIVRGIRTERRSGMGFVCVTDSDKPAWDIVMSPGTADTIFLLDVVPVHNDRAAKEMTAEITQKQLL